MIRRIRDGWSRLFGNDIYYQYQISDPETGGWRTVGGDRWDRPKARPKNSQEAVHEFNIDPGIVGVVTLRCVRRKNGRLDSTVWSFRLNPSSVMR